MDTTCQAVMCIILKIVTKCLIKSFRVTAGFQHQASLSLGAGYEQTRGKDRELEKARGQEGAEMMSETAVMTDTA